MKAGTIAAVLAALITIGTFGAHAPSIGAATPAKRVCHWKTKIVHQHGKRHKKRVRVCHAVSHPAYTETPFPTYTPTSPPTSTPIPTAVPVPAVALLTPLQSTLSIQQSGDADTLTDSYGNVATVSQYQATVTPAGNLRVSMYVSEQNESKYNLSWVSDPADFALFSADGHRYESLTIPPLNASGQGLQLTTLGFGVQNAGWINFDIPNQTEVYILDWGPDEFGIGDSPIYPAVHMSITKQ